MQQQPGCDVTGVLQAWRGGDSQALKAPVPSLRRELHRVARHCVSAQPPRHTLQTTAPINEGYLPLVDTGAQAGMTAPTSWLPALRSCAVSWRTTRVARQAAERGADARMLTSRRPLRGGDRGGDGDLRGSGDARLEPGTRPAGSELSTKRTDGARATAEN